MYRIGHVTIRNSIVRWLDGICATEGGWDSHGATFRQLPSVCITGPILSLLEKLTNIGAEPY